MVKIVSRSSFLMKSLILSVVDMGELPLRVFLISSTNEDGIWFNLDALRLNPGKFFFRSMRENTESFSS